MIFAGCAALSPSNNNSSINVAFLEKTLKLTPPSQTVEPKGEATNVSWAMQGRQPFMAKVMSTLINCDKMVGREFESGLAKLKALAEA